MHRLILALALLIISTATQAGDLGPRDGWVVLPTDKPHGALLSHLKATVKKHKMGVVTQAGPTATARKRGIDIPQNRVIGVFNNDYAVRVLGLSTAAMIEAPIRFYVTENTDGSATLSYKTPSFIFEPYIGEGGAALAKIAAELDGVFAAIAQQAAQ